MRLATLVTAGTLAFAACGGGDASASADAGATTPDATIRPLPAENWQRDVVSTDLRIHLETRSGTATVTLAGDTSTTASLSVGDLRIDSVRAGGVDLLTARDDTRLDIGVPDDGEPIAIEIRYGFATQSGFSGYMSGGSTVTWPYFCGNLFPCRPDPADGATYTMSITGVPDGQVAVYPAEIPAEAPAYTVAFTHGEYTYAALGTTSDGTEIGVHYLGGGEAAARSGADFLLEYVDFYEQTYGAYTFGPMMAAVAVKWRPGALGGIEHHPLFHIADAAMDTREFYAHEAAHGWYGNGVRIACWEDLVLSEGVAEYMMVRAVEAAEGTGAADALWATVQARLEAAITAGDTAAYPSGCNAIDILIDPLWSRIPYEKGALFLRAVEQRVGRSALDAVLAAFYVNNVGTARHMSDLLAAIETDTGADISDLVAAWLEGLGIP